MLSKVLKFIVRLDNADDQKIFEEIFALFTESETHLDELLTRPPVLHDTSIDSITQIIEATNDRNQLEIVNRKSDDEQIVAHSSLIVADARANEFERVFRTLRARLDSLHARISRGNPWTHFPCQSKPELAAEHGFAINVLACMHAYEEMRQRWDLCTARRIQARRGVSNDAVPKALAWLQQALLDSPDFLITGATEAPRWADNLNAAIIPHEGANYRSLVTGIQRECWHDLDRAIRNCEKSSGGLRLSYIARTMNDQIREKDWAALQNEQFNLEGAAILADLHLAALKCFRQALVGEINKLVIELTQVLSRSFDNEPLIDMVIVLADYSSLLHFQLCVRNSERFLTRGDLSEGCDRILHSTYAAITRKSWHNRFPHMPEYIARIRKTIR